MQLYQSKLPRLPDPIEAKKLFFNLEFSFGRDVDAAHMQVLSGIPELTMGLTQHWLPYREHGTEHLGGHPGYFMIAVPNPEASTLNPRLHIAVPCVDIESINTELGVRHRQDFDRLMDLVANVVNDMTRAGFIAPGDGDIDIIAEPLSPTGQLTPQKIAQVSDDIGVSWFYDQGHPIFKNYRRWNPDQACWRSGAKK